MIFLALVVLLILGLLLYGLGVTGRVLLEITKEIDEIERNSRTTQIALSGISCTLDHGVNLRDGTIQVSIFSYNAELYFDNGVRATGRIRTLSDVGYEAEIEILDDQGDGGELIVVFDRYCFVRHTLNGLPELHIPVSGTIDAFRDRLLSDGWKITSPDFGGRDDEVLSDNTTTVDQGV